MKRILLATVLVLAAGPLIGAASPGPGATVPATAAPAAPAESPAPVTAGGFTDAQRREIVSVVRDALRTDPSILRDAIASLRAEEQKQEARAQDDAVAAHRAELATGDATAGNPRGDVTVLEFFDPRCGYCKRMVPTLAAAIAADPKLRVLYRVIPILGPASLLEARAIVAAGLQGGYIAMKDALMAEAAPADAARIGEIAASLRLDPARLARDMPGAQVTGIIEGDLGLARALHVDGTPALVIGGQLIPGALPGDELRRAISDARA